MRVYLRAIAVCLLAGPLLTGCSGMNHTQRNSLAGTALGTTAGAIIGHQSGHGIEGAALGAVAGGLTGAVVGSEQDKQDAEQARLQRALTDADLIRMTQSGMSDEVIISSVRSRGGRFDLSPDALIALRQAGVSERVILEIQHSSGEPVETVLVSGRSRRVVVVRPLVPRVHVRPAVRRPVFVARPRFRRRR